MTNDSPIIVIMNKCDERSKSIDEDGLKKLFPVIVNFHKIAKREPDGPDIFDVHYAACFVCMEGADTFLAVFGLPANIIWQHHLLAVNNYLNSWIKLEGFNIMLS